MIISISFSFVIYEGLTYELDRVERLQQLRIEYGVTDRIRLSPPAPYIDPDIIIETKGRIATYLLVINGIIFGVSGVAGYFLAGKTLKPIQKMVEDQNRFISDSSHELRTPLTSLKTEIEVNLRNNKLSLPIAKKLLKSNLEEVNNLQSLSDNLIKLTRYQDGGINNFIFTDIDIKKCTLEAVKKVSILADKKGIRIANQIIGYPFEGNEASFTELFVILLDNAVKYSPDKTKIALTNKKIDGHIIFEVTDRGMGISQEDIPHIFDRFYRVDESRTKNDISGYGLGLSIAKEIVSRHHGHITVDSKIGKGSTFIVRLPVKQSTVII